MKTTGDTTTEALMERFQRTGDAAAFETVVARCLPPAVGVARQLLGRPALAEDAVQEAMLRVLRCRESYDPSRPFRGWFFAILRNVCVDMLRRDAHQLRLTREAAERYRTASAAPQPDGGAADLLAVLPRRERDVLALRVLGELSFREVAEALGVSEEAAKKRAQRGLARLRRSRRVRDAAGPVLAAAGGA